MTPLTLLTQETTDLTGQGFISLVIRSYGIAAPVIIGLGFLAWTLWKRLVAVQDELLRVLHAQTDKVVPIMGNATHQLNDNSDVLERATVMMHQLAGRAFDPLTQSKLLRALSVLDDRKLDQIHDLLRRLEEDENGPGSGRSRKRAT